MEKGKLSLKREKALGSWYEQRREKERQNHWGSRKKKLISPAKLSSGRIVTPKKRKEDRMRG